MDRFLLLFEQSIVHCVGLVLLHFVWQGVLIAVCLACGLRLMRRRSADARYVLSVAALALMTAFPIGTFFLVPAPDGTVSTAMQTGPSTFEPEQVVYSEQLPTAAENHEPPALRDSRLETWSAPADLATAPTSVRSARETGGNAAQPAVRLSLTTWDRLLVSMLPWIVSLWAIGVFVLSLRLAGSWLQVARLKWQGTQPVAESLQNLAERVARQLGVRRSVAIFESTLAAVPCLIGVLRPTILLPASALTGLSPEQLESILAHELAHVRRHDCLITVIQAFVEILLFYHPGVWWVSRQIRVERENCCDDLALSIVKSRLLYAQALADMAHLVVRQNQLTAAADGADLLSRIRRIVGVAPAGAKQSTSWWAGVLMLVVLAALATAVSFESMVRLAQADEPELAASDGNTDELDGAAAGENGVDDRQFCIFDDFEGELALNWEILHPDPTHVSLQKNPGKLTITSQFGGFHADDADVRGVNPGKNQYLIPDPTDGGDFVVTTCLEDFHPDARHQQAGPVIYDDQDNYFKALIGVGWGDVLIGSSWESRNDFQGKDVLAHAMKWDRTWLRITKRGKAYEAAYSFDGKEYTVINEHVWGDGAPQRIGLAVMNENGGSEPIDAVFDFFEIRSLTAEERDDPAHHERQKFRGVWETVPASGKRDGTRSPSLTRFAFNGTAATITERQTSLASDFSVYPDREPKLFCLSRGGRGVVNSAYRFEGDQLIVCMNTRPDVPAPADFEPGAGRVLIRLRRTPEVVAEALERYQFSGRKRFRMLDTDWDNSVTREEFLVDFSVPESTRQGMELFAIVDRDDDEKVSLNEFESWPRETLTYRFDLDADGGLSEDEFVRGDVPEASLERAREIFRLTDVDEDGLVSPEEFFSRPAESWFARLDSNEDDRVSYKEYASGNQALVLTNLCRSVFDAIDTDNDGSLDSDEYAKKGPEFLFLKMEGEGNGDGRMTFEEFTVWKRTPRRSRRPRPSSKRRTRTATEF